VSSEAVRDLDREGLADLTLRLIAEASPSGQEGAVARLVAGEMTRLGFQVEIDRLGNVVGTIGSGSGPCLLIDSHMDTVGVSDPGAWSHPSTGARVGDRIYGRGAMDMKGPLAASIHGAALLRGRLPRGRVVVSASVAEELVEGPALVEVARRVLPDCVLICEASSLRLAVGQRGRAEVAVETLGSATHSSRPELGVNAAEAMADVIHALRTIELPRHPALGPAILVLTDVISRPYPGLSVVPDRCLATFDRRTLPGETAEAILAPVRKAIGAALAGGEARWDTRIAEDDFASYTGARISAPNFAEAWYVDPTGPLVQAALAGLLEAGLEAETTHYAFCTNGSGTAALGIPTLGFGPGDESLAHRVDECIELSALESAALGYYAISRKLLGGAPWAR
jgi:putative selenium metabolism hydrolase